MHQDAQVGKDLMTTPFTSFRTIRVAVAKFGIIGSIARYLILKDESKKFVRRGASADERTFRRNLLRRYKVIQKNVPCAHSPYQLVLMADFILALEAQGPIVQCGCFRGGSTAKLSLLAERTGRQLYVCDSFQGLPKPRREDELVMKTYEIEADGAVVEGNYLGTLEQVRTNVERYGCIDVCTFVPGFFNESLTNLDVIPAFVFIDVDYVSSARDCLKHLWPRLKPGGLWFTHEAGFRPYVEGLLDAGWWKAELDECPPVIFGALSGLSAAAPSIAYFVKGSPR